MSIRETTSLLSKYELKAKKKYGQNFLVDKKVIDKITDCVSENDKVVEVGPGLGALTVPLAKKAESVTAYEIDEDLVAILNEEYPFENLTVINGDFLKEEIKEEKAVFVSNLPYYITGDILLKCFREKDKLTKMVVMMQKEVADKFFKPKYEYGVLNVLADYYSEYHLVCKAGKNCFIPAPNVDSAVIEFVFNEKEYDERFTEFLNACFSARRKLLAGNLKKAGYEVKKELDNIRVEELSSEQLHELYKECL